MLKIIQIIALLQGIFLVFVLIKRRQAYKMNILIAFIACLISIMLFALGDDDYNLILSESNWFVFQEPLMITCFLLFVKQIEREQSEFVKTDFLILLPYLVYLSLGLTETFFPIGDAPIIDIVDDLIEFSLIGLLLKAAFDIIRSQKEKWLLTFIIPFVVIFAIDEMYKLTIDGDYSLMYLDSYGVILISTFLFYFVSFRLITTPKNILVTATNKYVTSNLSKSEINSTVQALHQLMIEKKIFKNQKLSVAEVAKELGITRQQLSEILNNHMKIRFQDLLNQYRVEEFIDCLDQEKYNHYTLLGIASEAGFSSKSSFNSTFKKLKGVTPSQYRDSQK